MSHIIPITDFADPQLDVYARLTENQLINRHEPEKGLFIAFAHYISPQFRKNNPYFSNFVQKKLNLTPYCNDVKDLEKLNHLTSVFMTGSDQVFNPQLYQTHGGMIYLLSFVHKDKKKLSFAASFGDNIFKTASKVGFHGNEGEREEAADFLKQFDALSFREKRL